MIECNSCPLVHVETDELCSHYCKDIEDFISEIQIKAIKNFAEWLINNMFNGRNEFWKSGTPSNKPLHMEDFISEYEKERKNDNQNSNGS